MPSHVTRVSFNIRAQGTRAAVGSGQGTVQPPFRDRPFALDRGRGRADDRRRFLDRQAAEEPELHDSRLIGIERFEFLEHPIELDQIDDVDRRDWRRLPPTSSTATRTTVAAVLVPLPPPRIVDENPPHQTRSDSEEVRAVLPVDPRWPISFR